MKNWFIILFVSLSFSCGTLAYGVFNPVPAKLRFKILAEKMRLKTPEPKEGDYEVRIWNSQSFQHGDAQMLYVLTKKDSQIGLSKYILKSNKTRFKSSRRISPKRPVTDSLWLRLIQEDILSLPNEGIINNQLHPVPKSHSAHTDGRIEEDGSFTIYGYKTERSVWVLDGESYYFELFGSGIYQIHEYDNPKSYLRAMPNVIGLQKVVGILTEISSFFTSSK